jgi:Protein of unknown function (DUF2934)
MSEYTPFDMATYESSRTYLKSALEHMLEAGRSTRELSEFALEKFGDEFLPYLQQFLRDVCCGQIIVDGLTRSAMSALLGYQVSDEERERMIREAAYLRAEQRCFWMGSSEQDWLEAERQVDMQLARAAGLMAQGGKALASATALMEKELANSRKVVMAWLDENFPASPAAKRTSGRKQAPVHAVKSTPVRKRASGRARPGPVKRLAGKTATVKKTAATGNKAATTKKKAATTTRKKPVVTRAKAATTKKKAAVSTRKKVSTKKRVTRGKLKRR